MDEVILVINAGSSSIKFSLFTLPLTLIYQGEIDGIHEMVRNAQHKKIIRIDSAKREIAK